MPGQDTTRKRRSDVNVEKRKRVSYYTKKEQIAYDKAKHQKELRFHEKWRTEHDAKQLANQPPKEYTGPDPKHFAAFIRNGQNLDPAMVKDKNMETNDQDPPLTPQGIA